MHYRQRREKILSMLDVNSTVTIQQLVELLGCSEATIRRDVVKLEAGGDLQRYWGGVRRVATPQRQREDILQTRYLEEDSTAIGQAAAAQLQDNEMIFIGSGTTTLTMIPYISNRNIHVITNGIPQLEALHRRHIQALLLCGFFKEYSRSVVGKETVDMLRGYKFDRAFMGANGVDDQFSLLSADEYEDEIKALCICKARCSYLLVGREKFHRTAYYAIPNSMARDVTVITDYPAVSSGGWKREGGAYLGKIGDLAKGL